MTQAVDQQLPTRRVAIAVRGIVQGVGFRPFVYNTARLVGVRGWVRNEPGVVRIEVQGTAGELDAFLDTLRHRHPPQARVDAVEVSEIGCVTAETEQEHFVILSSPAEGTPCPTIPADLATCSECLAEIRTPGERRHCYPFTNCTNCGPRWSIIRQLPYDRPRTSMAAFGMCPQCEAEYRDPADRRFHAQPIACPQCGPQLAWEDAAGRCWATSRQALEQAAAAILAGQIVALKGLGGFQLLADATVAAVVSRLRQRKRRPDKPFAVMFGSLEEVRRQCEVSAEEAGVLESPQAPIVLLRRVVGGGEAEGHPIADAVAPGNPYLGVMLPYTPLHHVLLAAIGRPVVCTSGNLAEEPMAIDTEEARRRLAAIADGFLVHDRPIVRPVDDSVVRAGPAGLQVLRRARGYAPLPIELGVEAPTILAVGGHLKNTVALGLGSQVILSAHIGDLDNVASVEVHERAVADLLEFFRVQPDAIACDLHPDYASTRHAESLAERWGVPLIRVQHHHAHVAACAAEHRVDGPLVGLAWDGTGYGPDGTVWGGEALACEEGEYARIAHLRPFSLPGGDRAVREPRRSALGLLHEIFAAAAGEQLVRSTAGGAGPATAADPRAVQGEPRAAQASSVPVDALLALLSRPRLCPRTSSIGRLFDAVAALCGFCGEVSFEGQAAAALEFAADADCDEAYPLPLSGSSPAIADWEPMLRQVLADRAAGLPVGRISARFHNALAECAVAMGRRSAAHRVALTGGCFQNSLLSRRVQRRLVQAGFDVLLHREVPPGDGGIAVGQVAVARRRWARHVHSFPERSPACV